MAELIEQNNRVQQLLTGVGFYLWTDGKIGGYVRYVADGQRFGWRDELVIEEHWVRAGRDAYVCPECGGTEMDSRSGMSDRERPTRRGEVSTIAFGRPRTSGTHGTELCLGCRETHRQLARDWRPAFLPAVICRNCGASLGPEHFRPAPRVAVPHSIGMRRVPNGQEVISIVGGLELNTPVWANEQHEFPYLQW